MLRTYWIESCMPSPIQGGLEGGGCAPPPTPFGFFFLQKRSLRKLVLIEYELCLKMLGNGHFRDPNFQKFLWGGGGHASTP